jgi:hypothetical protein
MRRIMEMMMSDLAGRIHALTGPDREINFEIAILLEWRGLTEIRANLGNPNFVCRIPRYTESLDATLAEIRGRDGLYQMSNSLGKRGNYRLHFNLMMDEDSKIHGVEREDRNEALAALEALVRAVESER